MSGQAETIRPTRIGFVGAGLMGAPMVRNLLAAGHHVIVSSRTPERLAHEGWEVVPSPDEAADSVEIVCSIVPDWAEVNEVVKSVLLTARPGTLLIEMSTIGPDSARRLAARCAAEGVHYLDCPVSGGPVGAAAGTLAIWAGGDEEQFERARPILEVLGSPEKVRYCGPVGSGLVVKLCNNFLGAVNAAASAEALAMARKAGVDPGLVVESVADGTGANWQLANLMPNKVLRGDFTAGFKVAHMAKDLRAAADLAREVGLDAPFMALAKARISEACEAYGDEADYGSVARLVGW